MTRFGSTASDTLQALHRAADLELADEGGIAPLEVENARRNGRHGKSWDGPVPLSLQDARAIYRRLAWSLGGLVLIVLAAAWVGA